MFLEREVVEPLPRIAIPAINADGSSDHNLHECGTVAHVQQWVRKGFEDYACGLQARGVESMMQEPLPGTFGFAS